jgi:hypothetical protein
MRRSSIRSLMAVVVAAAVGLAALRDANEWWARAMLLVALAAIWNAVLKAVVLRDKEKYRQAGFALACDAYLIVALGPLQPSLGTTRLLNYLHAQMHPPLRLVTVSSSSRSVTYAPGAELVVVPNHPVGARLKMPTVSAAPDAFLRVGHCLFALLAGLAGGMVAGWFYGVAEAGRSGVRGLGRIGGHPLGCRAGGP